jgi:hypothetical protein
MKRIIVAAVLCAIAPLAGAQLYKYVDKDGKTVYTDQPPPTVDGKQINVPSSATPGSTPSKSALERDKELEKSREKAREAAKKSDQTARDTALKQERCTNATTRYRAFQEGGRISKFDEKGERVMMNDQEIETEREKSRQQMEEACKG